MNFFERLYRRLNSLFFISETLDKSIKQFQYVWQPTRDPGLQSHFRQKISHNIQKRIGCFGCSNTYGAYLSDEETWPHLLSTKLKDSILIENLGVNGIGVEMMVRLAYDYIIRYKPEAICCLFPDIYRHETYSSSSTFNKTEISHVEEKHYLNKKSIVLNNINNSFLIFVKNFLFLKTICKAYKVKFIWHTWCPVLLAIKKETLMHYLEHDTLFFFKDNYLYDIGKEVHKKITDYASDGLHHGPQYNEKLSSMFAEKLNG